MPDQQGEDSAVPDAHTGAHALTPPARNKSYRGGLLPAPVSVVVKHNNLSLWSPADDRLYHSHPHVVTVPDLGGRSRLVASTVVNTICLQPDFVNLLNRVANTRLTHVTNNVYSALSTNHLSPITIPELYTKNLAGHHILIDVPLRHLKAALKQIQKSVKHNTGAPLSALFLVPKGKFFSKPTEGMKLIGEYAPELVYSTVTNSTVHLPSVIEVYLCDHSDCLPPPPTCSMAAFRNGNLTMQFDALISHAGRTPTVQINVLLDSGATHCFIPHRLATHLGVTVLPSTYMSTGLGNGNGCKVLGECSLSLEIQGVRDTVKCLVLENFLTGIDMVLGNNWHKTNKAVVN